MDTVDSKTRSRIMSSVRQKGTGPERLLRSALHRAGLRYRLHIRKLPGSPDLVFPRFNAVIFVHGCYWHSHDCCKATVPKSRREFWEGKFLTNRKRDERNVKLLRNCGWRVMVVWECALVGKEAMPLDDVVDSVRTWLISMEGRGDIPGSLHQTMSSI